MSNHVGAITCPGFKSDVFNMPFNRAWRDSQFQRSFLCRKAKCNQAQYFVFTIRKLDQFIRVPFHEIPLISCDGAEVVTEAAIMECDSGTSHGEFWVK